MTPLPFRCRRQTAQTKLAGARSALLRVLFVAVLLGPIWPVYGVDAVRYVSEEPGAGRFALSTEGATTVIVVSENDHPGVLRAARDLQVDIERVTGRLPSVVTEMPDEPNAALVLIGTAGKSPLIDDLVRSGKFSVAGVADRWETFVLETVPDPAPGVDRALVIAGSDKRGTVFGIYDLSQQIGVSPWYYWADVPVTRKSRLYVLPGRHTKGEPAVRYRGIFLNDENPALLGWVNETFGGFDHHFYETVFELILRMKGNYLWPAMWGKAFADDDPLSPTLADEYGVVIGTTHHEPMMRAHVEWSRYGTGPWNYEQNPDTLRSFWREGIERMGDYESIVSLGMRGDGDEPMTQGTAIAILERIVADQRRIIEEVTGRAPSEIPQLWALYKEVQDYYDQGMDVPDDVTLLFADDNWGNIRRLPQLGSTRPGGYGVYYHYDYVGGPRNYKWINTSQVARIWEQMHLAYRYGADRIWIVNVGDLKPMEYPIEFFLDYAWNPEEWPADRLPEYARRWAASQFGEAFRDEIARFLTGYTTYNSRRKPELLSPDTYSLDHYREFERVVDEYNALAADAEALYEHIPKAHRDAYYQLVLYPVMASANLNDLYFTTAMNRRYAAQGRAATNDLAERARELFAQDEELSRIYHEDISGGKWVHMMSQTHIGYTYWQEPPEQVMPEVLEIEVPEQASMGVAVEGSDEWWPRAVGEAKLPVLDRFGRRAAYVEVFNRGLTPFAFEATSEVPWIAVEPRSGRVDQQERLEVTVDWAVAPPGAHRIPITVRGPAAHSVRIVAEVLNEDLEVSGFVESDGHVSIEAARFAHAVEAAPVRWQEVPDLGRTLSAVTPMPVTATAVSPGGDQPHLAYPVYFRSTGEVTLHSYLAPTLNFHETDGLRFAVSFDDDPPQIVNMHADRSNRTWEQWVSDNVNAQSTTHQIDRPGLHVLKFWMVDPGVVLQKLVIDTGGLQRSYLGPPESLYVPGQSAAKEARVSGL